MAVTLPEVETVTIDLLLEDQITVFLVPETLKVLVEPTARVAEELLILITVILLESFLPLTDAYMVAVPEDLAVTLPVELTVATDLLLELHVTLFLVLRTVNVLVELTVIVAEE